MKKDLSFLKSNLIAHRGLHNISIGIPENSMLAFSKAIEKKYIIELDVHILKDGQVVVFHDDNLKRITGVNKNVKDMTYNEISKLKLQDTNNYIPLFKDVLNLINGQVPVIIELKYDTKCGLLEKEVLNILKNYNGKFAIKSFSPFSIRYIRKHNPEIIRGQLASDFKKNHTMNIFKKIFYKNLFFNFMTKPDFISYDIRALPNNKILKLRKKMFIMGWTIRNEKDLLKAKKYCDNFICENIL